MIKVKHVKSVEIFIQHTNKKNPGYSS